MVAVLQINLQHSKAATATLCQKILADRIGVALIQEPWTAGGRIMGMSTAKGELIYDTDSDKPRACIFIGGGIRSLKVTNLCSRDCAVTEVYGRMGDGDVRILIASVYLPYDSREPPPTREMRMVVEYGAREGKHLLLSCDANAHHLAWGSSNVNERGALLTELPSEVVTETDTNSTVNKENTKPVITNKEDSKPAMKDEPAKNDESANNNEPAKNDEPAKKETNNTDLEKDKETADDLETLLKGFVLFYDAKKNSEIDKDDWYSALCESFKLSKFGPLEIVIEEIRPMRTRCILKWKNKVLASAEGLTETQAKTAATLQLISKLEPFTYIIQAKEEYFCGGKVPPFVENPDPKKSDVYRVVRRKDLPSYYSIFQTIDDFVKNPCYGEIIFGADFTWELKNEIVVYLKAKGVDYRYFTQGDQKPWTHMAVYHTVQPQVLKDYLLSNGGESEKYKLIPPQKFEPISPKTSKVEPQKEPAKPTARLTLTKVAEKRKIPEKEPSPIEELEANKIQIKLKKFKKDKVEYPEDTGGEFPGLILWLGVKKNSVWQRNLFCIIMDSFKMSKYGELIIEESEETVWGRKEAMKKCVIKANRKVLAVGLGVSKTEAKHAAALQVLQRIRKHCYTIQAKESYFKEGKATPYDFNPDPSKTHVYRLAKRIKYKDQGSILKFVDDFSKKICNEEIIIGDDFTYDEREAILQHCRKINLNYRLMKCQSISKGMHTHIAIYHQRPLPVIKAALIKAEGEDDRYLLIPPGGKITSQTDQEDLWPETLEEGQIGTFPKTKTTSTSGPAISGQNILNNQNVTGFSHATATKQLTGNQKTQIEINPQDQILHKEPLGPHPQPNNYLASYEQLQGSLMSDVISGPQSLQTSSEVPGPSCQEMPLAFGLQTQLVSHMQTSPNVEVQPELHIGDLPNEDTIPHGNVATPNTTDLRDELARKRQAEKENAERKVYEERKVIRNEEGDSDSWSRKVFLAEQEGKPDDKKSGDLREKLKQKDLSKNRTHQKSPVDKVPGRGDRREPTGRDHRRISPGRDHNRFSERDQRRSPARDRQRGRERNRFSPARNRERISPGRDHYRTYSQRNGRTAAPEQEVKGRSRDDRIRGRELPFEERVSRQPHGYSRKRSLSRSPRRSPTFHRGNRMFPKSSVMRFRDLWDNIDPQLCESIFMYKYVKQDSTTEKDPFALLRATRSLAFDVDFDFIKSQISENEWQVSVELVVTPDAMTHPLVGEGTAPTEEEAKIIAAHHAVDTLQKACRVIEPNYRYFAEGGVPEFIARKHPKKTFVYEIIQNLDPNKPLDRYTIEVMFGMFLRSDLEDLFFLATDFSYMERVIVIEMATQMNLWWRLFGPRHLDARPDDIVSTQHICVFKPKPALQLVRELLTNGGSTDKYTLVDPRESRITRSSDWSMRELMH